MEEKKVFVRKATGLVREISMLTGIIIVLTHVIGLGWQKRVFQFIGILPIQETLYPAGILPITMAFLIGGIIVLLNVYCVASMSAAMPRAGGGYVFISRGLSPALGFLGGWNIFICDAVVYGVISAAVLEAAWLFSGLAGITVPLSGFLIFGTALICMIIFAVIGILGTRPLTIVLHIIFWIPVVVTVCMYGLLLAATPEAMEAGIRAFTGHSAIEFTRAALDQGMAKIGAGLGFYEAVGACMSAAYWAYIGYAATSFVAGEVKEAFKTLPKILFAANITIILLYLTLPTLGVRAASMVGKEAGYSFASAWGFLTYGGGSFAKAGLPTFRAWIPVAGAIAAEGMGLGFFKYALFFFGVLWPANDIPPFIFVCSRLLFAMSFDRTMPEWTARVSERFHSPVNAIIITFLAGLIGAAAEAEIFAPPPWGLGIPFLHSFWNSISMVETTNLWDCLFFFLVSITAILFYYRRRDIYEKSAFKKEVAGVPLLTIIGILAFLGNLWFIWILFTNPYSALNPTVLPYGPITITVAIVFMIIGMLIYGSYKLRARVTGVDYSTIYAEVPPE